MKKLNQLFLLTIFSVMFIIKSYGQHTPGWLYTEGNKIKNSDGTIFIGRGVNIFDSRSCGAGVGYQDVDKVLDQIDVVVNEWGATFLRLCLESDVAGTYANADPVTVSQSYQDELIAIAEHVEQMDGVYILFSLWWEPTIPKEVGWPTDECKPVWKKLTEILSPYSHVLFGICNEPTSNWGGVNDADVWQKMNEVAQVIRDEEAKYTTEKHIIVAQGTWKYGRFVDYYVNHPITAGGGGNIAYETHPYDHPADWDGIFLDAADDIPVIIGEFGPAIVGGDEYMSPEEAKQLMELADNEKIPWAAWCYHSACGAENSMLTRDNNGDLITNDWGLLVKNHLLGISQPKISDFSSSPNKIYDHVDTEITFLATVTGEDNKTLSKVTLDLTDIGGSSDIVMNKNGNQYTYNYTVIAGTVATGVKTIKLTATDNEDVAKTAAIEISVIKLATSDLIIYNDNNTLITSVSEYYGNITETQNGGAYEGSKHYEFSYDYTQNWAGVSLVIKNRQGVDFSGYEAIQLACKITGKSLPDILLVDNTWATSNKIKMSEAGNSYQVFTIPISSFKDVNLSQIFEIQLLLGGQGTETGSFYFDDMRLTVKDQATSVTGVSLAPGSATMKVDETLQLTATVTPTTASNKNVSWKSDNTSVAIVNTTGLITAISKGNATISATTEDNNYTAISNVTVEDNATGFVEEIIKKKGFVIQPNPAFGDVTLKLNGIEGDGMLKVTDLKGEIVWQEKIFRVNDKFLLKTPGLSKGVYVVSLNMPNNICYSQLLVIK